MSTEKEEFNLKMSIDITNRESAAKYKLAIDEDTAFTIYLDVCKSEEKEYLYFKLEENTAVAPFFYDVSYIEEELIKIHPIFKSVNMGQAKEHLENLFNNKKVKLHYANEERTEIKMEIEAIWFYKKISIEFDLSKKMIREEEKDQLMIELYKIDKKNKKIAKLFHSYLKSNEGGPQKVIDDLLANFDLNEVINKNNNTNDGKKDNNNNDDSRNDMDKSGSLNNSNVINENQREEIIIENNENDEEFKGQMKKIFNKKKRVKAKKCEIGYKAKLNFVNTSKKNWPIGYIKFKINKEKSKNIIKDDDIKYPDYEIAPTQDGDFYFIFDENAPAEFSCTFDTFAGGNKLENIQLELSGKTKNE